MEASVWGPDGLMLLDDNSVQKYQFKEILKTNKTFSEYID